MKRRSFVGVLAGVVGLPLVRGKGVESAAPELKANPAWVDAPYEEVFEYVGPKDINEWLLLEADCINHDLKRRLENPFTKERL